MAIKLVEVGTAAVVGAADIVTEYIDERKGYLKSFQNVTDWGRVVYTVGGAVADRMEWMGEDYTKPAVLAGIPLLEKSLLNLARETIGKTPGKSRTPKDPRMGLKLKRRGGGGEGNIRWG